MGKKLGILEEAHNTHNLTLFRKACNDEYKIITNVLVLDEDNCEILELEEVTVTLGVNSNYTNVNIIWEDGGISEVSYKRLGLYGYYSSSYIKMEYKENERKLYLYPTDGGKKTIIIDAI